MISLSARASNSTIYMQFMDDKFKTLVNFLH